MVKRFPLEALLCLLALCSIMAGCGSSSSTATSQSPTPSQAGPAPAPTVTQAAAKTCAATARATGAPEVVGGNLYFVHSAGEARKLSGVPVVAPVQLPSGLVIQGFEVPLGGGYPSPTPKPLAIVTIDLTRECDLRSPTLIRLEESIAPQSTLPDQGTAKKLALGGKPVTWTSSERYDDYEWRNNGVWYSLTVVSKGAIPLPQAEAIIVNMPGR